MKATELRLGNLISFSNRAGGETEMIVEAGDFFRMVEDDGEGYNPIPLTEEWLVKFGFEKFGNKKTGNQLWSMSNPSWSIWLNSDGTWDVNFWQGGKKRKYVHQLQNLFHALTNEELTIK